jgi:hypothetical protein
MGTHCVGSICFTNTTGPFTLIVNWSTNGGATFLGEDKITVSCPSVNPTVTPRDPCCPPWNMDIMMERLVYHGQGSITDPYTLNFNPTHEFNLQMQNYYNYLHLGNSNINKITITWGLFDHGNNSIPNPGSSQIGPSVFTWWDAGTSNLPYNPTNSHNGFFNLPNVPSPFPMKVGTWYRIGTGIYLEPFDEKFFPANCATNNIFVRVRGSVLEYSYDGITIIKTVPIP